MYITPSFLTNIVFILTSKNFVFLQVEINTESPVCIETYAESKELGRFMLRAGGKTIAAGMITAIY